MKRQIKAAFAVFMLLISINTYSESVEEKGINEVQEEIELTEQNLIRAMEIADKAFSTYFSGNSMVLARYYNPFTQERSEEKGSIWMYTSAIEAVNAILHSLELNKLNGNETLHDQHFERYVELLDKLYQNADYYLGTFRLTSYTQTREWSVYGVHRSPAKGSAKVAGIENVYDDQMWLIRELIESYELTGDEDYLEKAEYLTEYVLDGWDCTYNSDGNETGGITWGPGYVTKHACSNGPMVSPLVWLHELYEGKKDEITSRYIDADDRASRLSKQVKKSEYYLEYAKKIYNWQKENLLRNDGVYDDMMGGCSPGKPQVETINGVAYRKGIHCQDRVGPAITYNSGTMLSGAADLFRATVDGAYLKDAVQLANASFSYFAKPDVNIPGYYSYDVSGFRNWFNGVLMRGLVDVYPHYVNVDEFINSFQKNLDHGYEHFLFNGILPTNLLTGWNSDVDKNNTEAMFSFAFAAQYAKLAEYEIVKERQN